jgi:hypothetical protein
VSVVLPAAESPTTPRTTGRVIAEGSHTVVRTAARIEKTL